MIHIALKKFVNVVYTSRGFSLCNRLFTNSSGTNAILLNDVPSDTFLSLKEAASE